MSAAPRLGLLALTLAACTPPTPEAPRDAGAPARARAAVVWASGDVRGTLIPVPGVRSSTVGHAPGAPRPPSPAPVGGLARRAAVLGGAPGLYVDTGDLWFPSYRVLPHRRAAAWAGAQAHAAALRRLGLAAMAVGEGDLAFGQEGLRSLGDAAGARLLSANLVQAGTSSLAFSPFAVLSQDGLQLGVVGASAVLAPERPEADAYRFAGVEALAPAPAVARAAASARAQGAEVVLALLHMPEAEAQAVLRALPAGAVDAALWAHAPGAGRFHAGGGAPAGRGRGLVRLALASVGGAVAITGAADVLTGAEAPGWGAPEVPDVPAWRAPAGPEACAARCHPGALAAWKTTAHARAMATLAEKRQARNPDCLVCHATASDPARPFVELQAEVSCEACHGRSEAHRADGVAPPEHGRAVPGWVCGGCHGVQATQGVFHPALEARALVARGHGG